MESQGEREPGVVGMDEGVLESMVEEGDPEQEMLVVEEQELPQTDPEPEMGAAAAAAYDTSTPPLRQNPPIRLEQSAVDMILQAINGMKNEIKANTNKMEVNTNKMKEEIKNNTNGMKEEMKKMRGEMRQMGLGLQAGIMAFASDEMWTAGGKKMAPPRAGTNELEGSATAGEDRVFGRRAERDAWR